MRPLIVALGLAAAVHGLPAAPQEAPRLEERQFSMGDPSVTMCIGSCRPSSPLTLVVPQPTGGFIIGKRDETVNEVDEAVVTSCTALAKGLSPPSTATSATRLVMQQCILLFHQHSFDLTALGAWSDVQPSKRQEQVIIGSCTEADVAALTTAFKELVAQYGRDDVPYDVAVLLESIKAALFYCALAAPVTSPVVPDDVIIGDPVTPDPGIPGGAIIPDPTIPGGPIIPDKPIQGGPIIPDKPIQGGPIIPDKPVPGGPLIPE